MALSNLVGSAFGPVVIVFEVRQLGLSGLAIGAVAMLGNLGFLAGTFVTRRLGARIGIGPVICLSSPIGSTGMLVMALAPRGAALPVLVAGQLLFGFGIALFNLQSLSLRQAITPPGLRRRLDAHLGDPPAERGPSDPRDARHGAGVDARAVPFAPLTRNATNNL
jgi:hypothetical protein